VASFVQSAHHVIAGVSGHVFNGASWASPPTVGNLLISCWGFGTGQDAIGDSMPGWTRITDNSALVGVGGAGGHPIMFWKVAEASEATTPTIDTGNSNAPDGDGNHYLLEFSGSVTFATSNSSHSESPTPSPGVLVTPLADETAIIVTFLEYHTTLHGQGTPTSGTTEVFEEGVLPGGTGNPQHWVGYQIVDPTDGSAYSVNPQSFTGNGVKWGSITAAFTVPPAPPTPGLWVDWDGDGFGDTAVTITDHRLARMLPEAAIDTAQDNITADVKRVTIDRPGANDHYGKVEAVQMTVIIKNEDGKYNPDNTASPLYGKLKPGLHVWFGSNADATLTDSGLSIFGRFGGYIREIVPTPVATSPYEAQLICDDALARYDSARARVEFAEDRAVSDYRQAILDAIGETRSSLTTEADVLAFSGTHGADTRGVIVRGRTDNGASDLATLAGLIAKHRDSPINALQALEELNSLTGTRHFIQPGATKEEWYTYVTVPRGWKLDSAEDASIGGTTEIQSTSGYRVTAESVINVQEVEVRPTSTASGPVTVWRYADVPFGLTNNSPVSIVADFGDYVFDATASKASTGSTVMMTTTNFGDGMLIRLDSAGSSTVTALTVTGRPVIREPQSVIESTEPSSITAYGERRGQSIASDLLQSPALARGLADFHIWKFAQPLKRQKVDIANALDVTLPLTLYDVVTETLVQLSIAGRRFEITGIHEEWVRTATAVIREVRFSLDLQETPNQTALSFFRIGISGLGGTDGLAP